MSKKWFFKRRFARLSWEMMPEWVKWVAVDKCGRVFGYTDKPIDDSFAWSVSSPVKWTQDSGGCCIELSFVGHSCPDWRDLLFERPFKECITGAVASYLETLLGDVSRWHYTEPPTINLSLSIEEARATLDALRKANNEA